MPVDGLKGYKNSLINKEARKNYEAGYDHINWGKPKVGNTPKIHTGKHRATNNS